MPTINKGSDYFGVLTYTGDGSASATRIDTNAVNFTPDFVWIKRRSGTNYHNLYDVNRIVSGDYKRLYSNDTLAEESSIYSGLTNLNGFVYGGFTTGAGLDTNTSGATYVAWCWKAGSTATVNTSGTISSNVSVSTTAGFSIVTYTGNGSSSATVGHGLGVAPKMIIIKSRSATTSWLVMHTSLSTNNNMALESTAAQFACSATLNGGTSTSPTSSLFSFVSGSTNVANVNASAGTFVAYCWAEIAGFSRFTSYTGNGAADGPFVYCGFRPKFVMVKRTDTAGFGWCMKDSSRSPSNEIIADLFAESSIAEYTTAGQLNTDFLSNGFKLRQTNANQNANGGTYIVMAYAENPFKNANAR